MLRFWSRRWASSSVSPRSSIRARLARSISRCSAELRAAAAHKPLHPVAELDEQPHGRGPSPPGAGGWSSLKTSGLPHRSSWCWGPYHQHQAGGGQVVAQPLRRPVGEVGAADDAAGPLPLEQAAHLVPRGAGDDTRLHPGAPSSSSRSWRTNLAFSKATITVSISRSPSFGADVLQGPPCGAGYFLNRPPDTSQSPSWTPGGGGGGGGGLVLLPLPAACRPR